jgi:hypothetical protein
MSWVATAIVGSAVVGGYASSKAAGKAAKAQGQSSDAAINEQARQFDILQEAQAPYQQVGSAALNQLAALYGLPQYSTAEPLSFDEWKLDTGQLDAGGGGLWADVIGRSKQRSEYDQYVANFKPPAGKTGQADYSQFLNSPDYQFALQQGLQGVQNSAAAQGGLYSGNALRGITDYGQGMASQQLGNYANRLAGIAGVGQTAANTIGQGAMATGANVGNLLVGAGNARASGIINQANAWANTGNQLAMYYGMGGFGGGSPFGSGGSNAMAMHYGGPTYAGYA